MNAPSFRWLLFGLAFIGMSADLVSKYVVFRTLYDGTSVGKYEIIPGVFRFRVDFLINSPLPCDCYFVKLNGPVPPFVNHGALFGLGGEHESLANNVFLGISAVAIIAILYWGTRKETGRDLLLCLALGLILGGTIGNLFDRIVFGGVRDFLHFYLINWPVFNVADCCLVCGAGMLLLHAIRYDAAKQPTTESQVTVSAATQNNA